MLFRSICDPEMIFTDIFHCFLHGLPAFHPLRFIKSCIDLIAYAKIFCGINDSSIECTDRIRFVSEAGRKFFQLAVQSDAEVRSFVLDLADQLFPVQGNNFDKSKGSDLSDDTLKKSFIIPFGPVEHLLHEWLHDRILVHSATQGLTISYSRTEGNLAIGWNPFIRI